MKARVIWPDPIRDVFLSLFDEDRAVIEASVDLLQDFPYMYRVNLRGRRFKRHRRFTTGNWTVYYRVVENRVYIRGLWPSRMREVKE